MLRKLFHHVLDVPLFIKVMGVGVIVAGLFGVISIYQVQKTLTLVLYGELQSRTYNHAMMLAALVQPAIITKNYYQIHQIILDSHNELRDLRYLIIREIDGPILFKYQQRFDDQKALKTLSKLSVASIGTRNMFQFNDEVIVDVVAPFSKNRKLALRLGVSNQQVQQILEKITWSILWTLFLCMVLGQILAIFLTHLITVPINRLVKHSQKLQKGDFSTPFPAGSGDEIGTLSRSFEELRTNLVRYQERMESRDRERQLLVEQIIHVQEKERKAIARELHDQLGQSLSSLILYMKTTLKEVPGGESMFKNIEQRISAIIDEMRQLAWLLRPSILDDYGLVSAVERLIGQLKEVAACEIDFQVVGYNSEKRLPTHIETALYRVTQEAINNAIKHAQCSAISVLLLFKQDEITLLVEDNGTGFNVEQQMQARNTSLGIVGMRERIQPKGELIIESDIGKGTTVKATLPYSHE